MTTGPDNYDDLLDRMTPGEKRSLSWGVCFMALVFIGGVMLLNSTEPLPPPCIDLQTADCIGRLPQR